jgi:hypothetical protein
MNGHRGATWQRRIHFLRNILAKVPKGTAENGRHRTRSRAVRSDCPSRSSTGGVTGRPRRGRRVGPSWRTRSGSFFDASGGTYGSPLDLWAAGHEVSERLKIGCTVLGMSGC